VALVTVAREEASVVDEEVEVTFGAGRVLIESLPAVGLAPPLLPGALLAAAAARGWTAPTVEEAWMAAGEEAVDS